MNDDLTFDPTTNCSLPPVWPDLAKFRQFGKTLKVFGYSLRIYFVLANILILIGQIFMILDKFTFLLIAKY